MYVARRLSRRHRRREIVLVGETTAGQPPSEQAFVSHPGTLSFPGPGPTSSGFGAGRGCWHLTGPMQVARHFSLPSAPPKQSQNWDRGERKSAFFGSVDLQGPSDGVGRDVVPALSIHRERGRQYGCAHPPSTCPGFPGPPTAEQRVLDPGLGLFDVSPLRDPCRAPASCGK